MLFHHCLNEFKATLNIKTSKEFYAYLGGEKELGFKLRRFFDFENGVDDPPLELLISFFNKSNASDRGKIIKAYFKTKCGGLKKSAALLNYLEAILSLADVQGSEETIWDEDSKRKTYTDDQLDYLSNNESALRLHKNVLLYEEVSGDDLLGREDVIKNLVKLGLVKWDKNKLVPTKNLYRIPQRDFSPPKSVARANRFALKHIETYISPEGSDNQKLYYFSGLFKKDMAEKVLKKTKEFKNWVQLSSTYETDKDLTPLVFFTFAKALEPGEL